MSHKAATVISRIELDGEPVDISANGDALIFDFPREVYRVSREEALLLVEAITARLAEVTEGQ